MLQCNKERSFDINVSTCLQSQYVQHTAREVVIDRYQSGCCYLLNIHSQETFVHCNVYSHSFRFR